MAWTRPTAIDIQAGHPLNSRHAFTKYGNTTHKKIAEVQELIGQQCSFMVAAGECPNAPHPPFSSSLFLRMS